MKYCANCGTAVEEEVKFCPKCGGSFSPAQVEQATDNLSAKINKLHCPKCKSLNLISSTETSGAGAITTNAGGFAVTSVQSEHKDFWICRDCGTKFRNVQSISEELAKNKKRTVFYSVASVICLILCIVIFSLLPHEDDFDLLFITLPVLAAPAAFLISSIIFLVVNVKSIKKLELEEIYLKENCFN